MKILITGGAGFIGSNLVRHFLNLPSISLVRVIDDFSNGYKSNLSSFINHPKFEFFEGDICDYDTCLRVTKGIDKISHQAALGSVPRSIENPMKTVQVNISGTINILHSAFLNKVERVILACSSSTYGDSINLPKVENCIGDPLSPYAVTKYSIEQFAKVFNENFGLRYIGLRYFNVFGPYQSPTNPYAAVIPIFINSIIENKTITINGDGTSSRDFTYIDNVILANELALFSSKKDVINQIYNVAGGNQITLNNLVKQLSEITNRDIVLCYGPERVGDVKHSFADISKISKLLGYSPKVTFLEGLKRTYNWIINEHYS